MRRNNHAIALITTMAALVVVVMLIGAFLSTRQSYLNLARFSSEDQSCRDTLRSLSDFCRFRLEGQEDWAKIPGSPEDSVDFSGPDGLVFSLRALTPAEAASRPEFDGLAGIAQFEGKAPGTGVEFQLSISNNLDRELPNVAQQLDAKCCRLRIRASRGGVAQSVEVLLRRAAFFDSTVAASDDIEVDADAINFSSTDALRNQIRSKSKIMLPDIEDIAFTPDPDMQTPEKGTIWAQGDIEIKEDGSEEKLRQAADVTGGEFLPKAPTRYSVPKLEKSDLEDDVTPATPFLTSAEYVFEMREVTYEDILGDTYTRKIPILSINTSAETGGGHLVEFHFAATAMTESLDPTNLVPAPEARLETVRIAGATPATSHFGILENESEFEVPDGPKFTLPSASDGSGRAVLSAGVDYRVAGDFTISSRGLAPPQLDFVDEVADPENPLEGSLSASRDLVIQGHLGNCAKLLAGRDVQLLPRDVSVDKLQEGNDIAVYAGRDIMIRPIFLGDEADRNDSARYFMFRGLIYAENNFSFLSSVKRRGELVEFNRKLFVEGALVARSGKVLVQGNESVELKYNPKYLDDLLEKAFEEDHIQLEELSWRPL